VSNDRAQRAPRCAARRQAGEDATRPSDFLHENQRDGSRPGGEAVTRVRPERGNLWKDDVPSALSMREFTRGTLTMADDASLNVASACSGNTARYPRITIIPGTLAPYNPRRASVSAGRSTLFRYFRINPFALGIGIVPQQYNFLVAY